MELTVEVVGMKAFKGNIDGKEIDSGTLYSRVKLATKNNEQGKNFKGGECVEEWKMPNAQSVFAMQHLPYPFVVKLEVERVSNGTESKEVVMSVRPVESMAQRGANQARELKAA
jgi:hypothetical protein